MNENRIGNFTSSEIWKLTTVDTSKKGFGKPALLYIEQKNIERKMGRSLSLRKDSRATIWGNFLEQRVHELIPLEYESVGKITLDHPTIKSWKGSPDNINKQESIVGDTKCYEPENFAFYVETLSKGIEAFKTDYKQEYWQLISNACITGMKYIEAIVYCPYESELEAIRDMAMNYDTLEPYKYRFIYECDKSELPYIPDGKGYKNLNIFRFEAPKEDKEFLTSCVLKASTNLLPLPGEQFTTNFEK